jgi:L-asparaginase II
MKEEKSELQEKRSEMAKLPAVFCYSVINKGLKININPNSGNQLAIKKMVAHTVAF